MVGGGKKPNFRLAVSEARLGPRRAPTERHGKRGKRRVDPPRGRVSNDNNNLRSLGTRNE